MAQSRIFLFEISFAKLSTFVYLTLFLQRGMSLVVNIFKCTTIMIIKSNILYILSEKLSIHSQKRPPGHVLNSHEISKECIVAFLMGCDDPSPKRRASVMDLRHRQLFKRQDLSKELGQKGKIIPS